MQRSSGEKWVEGGRNICIHLSDKIRTPYLLVKAHAGLYCGTHHDYEQVYVAVVRTVLRRSQVEFRGTKSAVITDIVGSITE
jgi:hypothetical protein